jgi:hypothetical protein
LKTHKEREKENIPGKIWEMKHFQRRQKAPKSLEYTSEIGRKRKTQEKKKGVAALGEKDRLYINQGHASGR